LGNQRKPTACRDKKAFWPGPGIIISDLLGKRTISTTNEGNLEGRGFNKGQKKADGHSGTMSVPTARHARACLVTSTTKVKNDHRSKFSNLSNWREEA